MSAVEFVVAIGPTTVRLRSDSLSTAPWIRENFGPWTVGGTAAAAPDWTLDLDCDPARLAALRARRAEHGPLRLCFAHDTRLQRLPARTDESGVVVLADDERDAFLLAQPGRIEICCDDRSRRGRILLTWTLAELAATASGPSRLDLHAAAVTAGDRGVLILGGKGSGKTTLLLHLAASGHARLLSNDRVLAIAATDGWSLAGLPAPLRIRIHSLLGLPSLPAWATALARPYLLATHEIRPGASAESTREQNDDVMLGVPQVLNWLRCDLVTRVALGSILFPEIRGEETGWSLEPLPPAEVERRLHANRYGQTIGDREPTLVESFDRGRASSKGLASALAADVPGYVLRLGRDAHLAPGFAESVLADTGRTRGARGHGRVTSIAPSGTGGTGRTPDTAESKLVERISRALGEAPEAAYTTPLVYPWSVQHFQAASGTPRPQVGTGPFRLYVHVPFCRYRCSFCFYAVRTGADDSEKARYVAALAREFREVESGTPLSQLFVGGGTPTALDAGQLSRLLRSIFDRVPSEPGALHTVEASPDSITASHLDVLREHGVGRISMGIESLDDEVLDTVHRRHTPAEALESCRLVLEQGLRLNVDLIYGLPGQTETGFRRDVERAAAAGVSSLCLYALRLNANTPVATSVTPGERFDLGHLVRWRRFVFRTAEESGFVRTRPYFFERRDTPPLPTQSPNQPLLGIGMSARSQIDGTVFRNLDRTAGYVDRIEREQSPVETVFHLDEGDRRASFVAATLGNGSRLRRVHWEQRFGHSIDEEFGGRIAGLREGGLLDDDGESIGLSEDGLLVYDRVVLGFYPQARQAALSALPKPKPARARPTPDDRGQA